LKINVPLGDAPNGFLNSCDFQQIWEFTLRILGMLSFKCTLPNLCANVFGFIGLAFYFKFMFDLIIIKAFGVLSSLDLDISFSIVKVGHAF
jgi:hypothetical protein